MAPRATSRMPFMTPSRCAESPIRTLVNRCSANPVNNPRKNRKIPYLMSPRSSVCIALLLFAQTHSCVQWRQQAKRQRVLLMYLDDPDTAALISGSTDCSPEKDRFTAPSNPAFDVGTLR